MNSKRLRSGAIYLLLLIALGAFLYTSLERRPNSPATSVRIDEVAADVRAGEIESIVVKDEKPVIILKGKLMEAVGG